MTEELDNNNSQLYCNYVNMNMINEKYQIDQTLRTADIVSDIANADHSNLKKAFNF